MSEPSQGRPRCRARPGLVIAAWALALAACVSPDGREAGAEQKEPAMASAPAPRVTRGPEDQILIETDLLAAEVRPNGYVSGIAGGTLLDKKTGARDHSFGLDIVDFLMGPGAEGGLPYEFGNAVHGQIAKHYIEGPQVCTQAKHVDARVVTGPGFAAVVQQWRWHEAAPGRKTGSRWQQTLVFPAGRRTVLASDQVQAADASPCVFLRIDMPGHIRHQRGDTFEEVYLSYEGRIAASDFFEDFPPDARHLYQRGRAALPERFIRARKIRGQGMPWLAGITLDPAMVYEAWCHQRGYVCFIEEIGGVEVKAGDHFAAAYVMGYFDSIQEMEAEADRLRGLNSLAAAEGLYLMSDGVLVREDGPGEARFRIAAQGARPAKAAWQVRVHGRGAVTVCGQRIEVDGEKTVEVKP